MIDFSIVTAVYNTAEFIDEAIQSVVSQTVGIDRIQLILVNDASTDNSLELCRRWEQQYPGHITIVDQPSNQGVSAARNAGMQHVVGRYVNFMDSDDKLAPNVCEKIGQFFDQHRDDSIDVVAFPIVFFDADNGAHPLNDKFEAGTRIIDLDREWYYTQNFVNSIFVRTEALQGLHFDQRMPLSEDLKFVQEILLRTHRLGVISETQYLYRRRSTGQQSAIQGKDSRRVWYIPTLQNGLLYLANKSRNADGTIPRYIQYLMMYELQWRLKQRKIECPDMTPADCREYYDLIHRLLTDIDDEVIMRQRFLAPDTKTYAKLLKRGWSIDLLNFCRTTRLLKILRILGL